MHLSEMAATAPTILLLAALTIGLGATVAKAVRASQAEAAKAEDSKRPGSWGKALRVQMGDKWADQVGADR
jgi:invasion protein IalB